MICDPATATRRAVAALLIACCVVPVAAEPAKTPVKLAVIIAVDGLSWPTLERYRPWLHGGLARLLEEGQVETGANYAHLNTETGPGHASLGTGAPPRVHGIVANRWYEAPSEGSPAKRYYCTDQPDTGRVPGRPPLFYREIAKDGRIYVFSRKAVLETWEASGELGSEATSRVGEGPNGETLVFDSDDAAYLYNLRRGAPATLAMTGTIPGPMNLRVPTLADRLIETSPASQVVSLAGKDRSAIFLAGRNPGHFVYWFDKESGRYVTSAAYDTDGLRTAKMKSFIDRFNTTMAGTHLVRRLGTIWSPLPAPENADALPKPEPEISRFQITDLGLGFDHDLSINPDGYFEAVYSSPLQDELLADLIVSVLRDRSLSIGRRGVTDMLTVSFSANDTVSHDFGAESEEQLDTLRRVDIQIGRVLAALDALAKEDPAGSVVVAFSADHGFAPLPEVVRRQTGTRIGGRITGNEREVTSPFPSIEERLNVALAAELCLAPGTRSIKGTEGWSLTYDREAFPATTIDGECGAAGRTVTLADLDTVFPRTVAKVLGNEIERVLLISKKGEWDSSYPPVQFALNDFDAARSGDAFLVPRENAVRVWDAARGSGHGSHRAHDTSVPLIFWGGPFRPSTQSRASTPYDLAPTLGAVIGVDVPDSTGTSRAPAASASTATKKRR